MNVTQKQRAYEFLREKLISGELLPGSRLSDIALSREIGISRTPVREAINQLASEDLVELVPHTGAFVKVPDREELVELYDLRQLLETYAVTNAASRIDAGHLAQIEEMIQHMDGIIADLAASGGDKPPPELRRRWVMTDYAFHLVLFRAGGNRKVMRIASDLRMLTQVFIFRKDDPRMSPIEVMREANAEHHELFLALKKGDSVGASRVISRHIERAKSKTLANYSAVPNRDGKGKGEPEWLSSVREVIRT